MEPRDELHATGPDETGQLSPPAEAPTPIGPAAAAGPVVYWQPVDQPELPTGTGSWRGVGSVLGRTLDTFGGALPLFLVLGLPLALVSGLSWFAIASPVLSALLSVVSIVAGLLTTSAVILAADDLWRGRRPGIGDVFRRSLPRTPALFGNYVVLGLVLFGVLAVVVLILAIVGFAGTRGGQAATGAGLIGLVLFLVVVPVCIFVAFRWSLAGPAVVIERFGPVSALNRSWRLTRGCFWRLFALYIVLGLLGMLASVGALLLVLFSPSPAWNAIALGLFGLVYGPIAGILLTVALRDLAGRPDGDAENPAPPPRGRMLALALLLGGGLLMTVAGFAAGAANDFKINLPSQLIQGRGKLITGSVKNPIDACHPLSPQTSYASDEPIYIAAVFDRHVPAGEQVLIFFYQDDTLVIDPVPLTAPSGGLDCYYEAEPLVGAAPAEYRIEVKLGAETISKGTFTVE